MKISTVFALLIAAQLSLAACALAAPQKNAPAKTNATAKTAAKNGATSQTVASPYGTDWDDAVGLWISKSHGHTKGVVGLDSNHSATTAAGRLLNAARDGKMETVPALRVLKTIRSMQCLKKDDKYGCFRWYWEEPEVADTNAAFFVGIPLILLDRVYLDRLDPASRAQLKAILKDLKVWFDKEAATLTTIYPNKYMGDLVCDWLLNEALDITAGREKLEDIMRRAASDWREKHWGWGEHMSDGYAVVLMDELSMLLLVSKKLPADIRKDYQGLLNELLAIEDAYGNRPRVPAIRSYAFDLIPSHVNYRDKVRDATGADSLHVAQSAPAPGPWVLTPKFAPSTASPTLYQLGWHGKMPARSQPRKDISVALAADSEAVCRAEDDMMLGTITRYPLLPNTDAESWGLSWQSMPVAFLRQGSDWGFLRFYAKEGDRERGYPALERRWSYISSGLSAIEKPVPVGQTWSIQHGGDAVVLRIMPVVPASWSAYEDHLQVIRPSENGMKEIKTGKEGMCGLDFRYPERTFSVRAFPLSKGGNVKFDHVTLGKDSAPAIRWGLRFEGEPLHRLDKIVTLWGMSLNGPIENAPVITQTPGKHGQSFKIIWNWKGREWKLRIDLSGNKALFEE